jgi:beta-phosphoglucomutase
MYLIQNPKKGKKLHHGAIQAILFDCDGVVIDSEPVHERTLVAASRYLGHELTHPELMQLKGMNQEASAVALKTLASRDDVESAEIIQIRSQTFAELVHDVRLVPGVLKFIHRVRNSGFSAALTTSSGVADLKMTFDRYGLARFFDVIITGDDVTNCKPDPEPYLLTAERLGLEPNRCLVIEDSVNGIISATAAGCPAVGLTTSFPQQKLMRAGGIFCIDSFEELEQLMF